MTAEIFLHALTRRLRWRDRLWTASAALVVGAAVYVAAAAAGGPGVARLTGVAATAGVAAAGLVWRRSAWRPADVAALAEARLPDLENLLATAVASADMPHLAPAIRDEVRRHADARVATAAPTTLVPVGRAAAGAALALAVAAGAWTWTGRAGVVPEQAAAAAAPPGAALDIAVTVTPPAYLHGAPHTVANPDDVQVPAGGTVKLVARTALAAVAIDDPAAGVVPLEPGAEPGTFERSWSPSVSTTAALVARAPGGALAVSRLLTIAVAPDERPTVRIVRPGRDVRLPSSDAALTLEVEAADDHGVTALELRFVRMVGSGESFTFNEGRVPFTDVARAGAGLRGTLSWPLRALGLEAGESLVYRVVARDAAPGAPPGESESYTLDIGVAFETSGAGAAVAEEDRRYAISQQMVIVHTERALAERGATGSEAWLARTQGIGAEQRMVRAEVVFLGGGEVQDEVEEAERGDEVQEGRLENRGRAEMLRALGEMSRAEARLTAGDARGALVFERQALAALLRAFDRRRYFLRTVPERSRIDMTRRLTGDRRAAAPGPRVAVEHADPVATERALLFDLAAADPARAVPPVLAARLAALAPTNAVWSRLAAQLLAASDETARRAAVAEAAGALRDRVHDRLPPAPAPNGVRRDYLDGLWLGERRAGSGR